MWRRVCKALDSVWFATVALVFAWLWLAVGVVTTCDMIWWQPDAGKLSAALYTLLTVVLWHNAVDATRTFRMRRLIKRVNAHRRG